MEVEATWSCRSCAMPDLVASVDVESWRRRSRRTSSGRDGMGQALGFGERGERAELVGWWVRLDGPAG
jgi:hypothetical protein